MAADAGAGREAVSGAEREQPTARLDRKSAAAAALFPEAPVPDERRRGRTLLASLLGFIAGAAYLVLVPAGRSHLFRIWAEDGKDWLSDAVMNPPLTMLFDPLGGYFHLVPRLLAQAVAALPIEHWAIGMAVGAAAVRAATAVAVFHVARGHVSSRWARAVLAAVIIVAPAGNAETINNAANLHWFLFVLLAWLLLWRAQTRRGAAVAVCAVLLLCWSVPLAVVLLPLAVARAVLLPWRDKLLGIVLMVATLPVVSMLVGSDRPRSSFDAFDVAVSAFIRGPLVTLIGPQAATDLIVASDGRLATILLAGVCAAALLGWMIIGASIGARPSERFLMLGLIALAAVYGTLSLVSNWQDFLAVQYELRTSRYSALPSLLLTSAVVVAAAVLVRHRSRRTLLVGGAVAVIFAVGVVWQVAYPQDRPASPMARGITWSLGIEQARDECGTFDEDSVGITIMPHDRWEAVVPCELLTEESLQP